MEHKGGNSNFTSRYALKKLVYYETADDPESAIAREKQIKGLLRSKKMALIESLNPEWDDLSETWYAGQRDSSLRSE